VVLAGGSTTASLTFRDGSGRSLGIGGITWELQLAALVAAAAASLAVLLRDAGRVRWLARIREGRERGWILLPREEVKDPEPGAPLLLPYVGCVVNDGAIAARSAEGSA